MFDVPWYVLVCEHLRSYLVNDQDVRLIVKSNFICSQSQYGALQRRSVSEYSVTIHVSFQGVGSREARLRGTEAAARGPADGEGALGSYEGLRERASYPIPGAMIEGQFVR